MPAWSLRHRRKRPIENASVASYIFILGGSIVDSQQIDTTPGSRLDLTAVVAPDPKAAAE